MVIGERESTTVDGVHVQLDLLLGVLNGVGAVADVAANSEGEVATDGAYGGCTRLVHVRTSC